MKTAVDTLDHPLRLSTVNALTDKDPAVLLSRYFARIVQSANLYPGHCAPSHMPLAIRWSWPLPLWPLPSQRALGWSKKSTRRHWSLECRGQGLILLVEATFAACPENTLHGRGHFPETFCLAHCLVVEMTCYFSRLPRPSSRPQKFRQFLVQCLTVYSRMNQDVTRIAVRNCPRLRSAATFRNFIHLAGGRLLSRVIRQIV